jgi:hypothetical protein
VTSDGLHADRVATAQGGSSRPGSGAVVLRYGTQDSAA